MVQVLNKIVVPGKPCEEAGMSSAPYDQVHLHSTGNPNSSMENEKNYLANNWPGAYYTHSVGIDGNGNPAAWQVAATNGGGWDLGGGWNANGYASIEFVEGSIKTQDDFNRAYPVYVALARQLADECGADYTLDDYDDAGIKTHNFASRTGHGSDHIDPLGFLEQWGVSYDQLKRDIANGVGSVVTPAKETKTPAQKQSAIEAFKNTNPVPDAFEATGKFKISSVKQVNGQWQALPVTLGGKDPDWTLNGIPLDLLTAIGTKNGADFQSGCYVKFKDAFDWGTIDDYDEATNAIGIDYGDDYGTIWFDASEFIKL